MNTKERPDEATELLTALVAQDIVEEELRSIMRAHTHMDALTAIDTVESELKRSGSSASSGVVFGLEVISRIRQQYLVEIKTTQARNEAWLAIIRARTR